MFQILVVEDDKDLQDLFCTVLSEQGYHALRANNGNEALEIISNKYIDLMITDVMMPEMDGFELIKECRFLKYNFPILVVTARGNIIDKQEGFQVGTDDYMVKPIDVNEMVWRVQALLRRAESINKRTLEFNQTILDYDSLSVTYQNKSTILTQKEFQLLFKLLSSPGKIFTRKQIFDEIWDIDSDSDPHTLDVHMSKIRNLFKDNDDFEIVTIRGLGYKGVIK